MSKLIARCCLNVVLMTASACWAFCEQAGQAPADTQQTAQETQIPDSEEAEETKSEQPTGINLLGEISSESGESRRNENVQFNLVDNNALKELNVRLGTTATIVPDFFVDRGYFGSEFGKSPTPPLHAVAALGGDFHGDVFWRHNNSVLSARSFFQVGSVKPARENLFGGTLAAPLGRLGFITLSGSQNKIRGNVNGNVLVPLPEERTALATEPALRAVVQRLLDAYPQVAPNRPDIAARALNTNSIQRINTDSARMQIDTTAPNDGKLTLRYDWTAQNVDAFQLITGQNPDTDTKSHVVRMTWQQDWSPGTVSELTGGFNRLGTLLLPAEGALGPVMVGSSFTNLGPFPNIPLDRAQNHYRFGGTLRNTRQRHEITLGFASTRLQYNGEETDAARGLLVFRQNFGNDAITNVRLGLPSLLVISLGSTYRGFRNWSHNLFLSDRWQVSDSLTLSMGARYEPMTRPVDVTGRSDLAFDSDLNNVAGSFGFAYRLSAGLGTLRGAYGLHYGELFPVTYGQDRLNAPHTVTSIFTTPDLVTYRSKIDHTLLDPNARSSRVELGSDLVVPYSHQYNFNWEKQLTADWRLQLGYVGSRSHKLFITYFLNRAREIPGLDSTIVNINERRADRSIYEHLFTHNGSRGYFDAGRVSIVAPSFKGLSLNASYWISKSIDLGGSFTNTGSGSDARRAVSQTEIESQSDLKALSDFDQPHALLLQFDYSIPRPSTGGILGKLFGGWNFSAVTLYKSGTTFSIESGSDGPGFGNSDGRPDDRPVVLDSSILGRTIGDPDTSQSLLSRDAFRYIQAPLEQAGNLGRNMFRKGTIANVNASLSRRFQLASDESLEFRTESINFFNTPQFAEPGKTLTSPNFGQINNTLNDGRTFRFQLKLFW